MNVKEIIKKVFNPGLIILSTVLLFVHLVFENRTSWYMDTIDYNLIIICLSIFLYRTRRFKHSFLNNIYFWTLLFFCTKCFFNIIDSYIALIYNIHIHKQLLLIQIIPLSIFIGSILKNLLKKEKN